jgi:hypothetical protein
LDELQKHFEVETNYVEPEKLFPLFENFTRKYVFIAIRGFHNRKICHVDNGDFGFCFMANSLHAFLDKCYG